MTTGPWTRPSGNAGTQTVDFGGNAAADGVAIQPDGKIVLVGGGDPSKEIVAARLNRDGSIDTGFGVSGEQAVDVGGQSSAAAVALQPDGKIVMVGGTLNPTPGVPHIAVVRLTA